MKDENSNNGFVELWGQDFKRAKDGLDEEQIVSFVNELINERDTLLQRQEHLSSLSILAERTIAEADNVAKQLKEQAEEQAKAEADAIIARAEEQTQQIFEEKKAEAIAVAEQEAETIRANAQQEAALLQEKETEKIQSELEGTAHRLYGELLSQLENLKQQVIESEANFGRILSQPEQSNLTTIEEEKHDITPDADLELGSEVSDNAPADTFDQIETIDEPDVGETEEMTPVLSENYEISSYQEEVELEIQPPVEMRKVMAIIGYLDTLAEVRATELIPLADKPIIKVSLHESVHLIEMLGELPEVGQATDIAEGDERKIQITLT